MLSLILLISIFSLKFLNLSVHFPNINDYLSLLEKFSILIVILFFLLLIHLKEFFNFYLKKDLYEIYLPLIFMIGMHFIIIPFPPRYGLPAYPLLFIVFAFALNKLFRKYSYLFVLIVITLFITSLTGNRSLVGFALEDNLEYKDFIRIRQEAANFISENYQNATILVAYPSSLDLQHPYGKYVKEPINIITVPPFPGLTEKNYTKFLNPNLYPEPEINLSSIDIYYYSPQEYPNKKILDASNQLNLTLIKKFEKNNKTVEIYKVIKS